MKKSLLEFYLNKVKAGDDGSIDDLCSRLAERLIFVPVTRSESTTPDGSVWKIKILKLKEGERELVPTFTTESFYQAWSKSTGLGKLQSISIFGADICAALEPGVWLSVDIGTPHEVNLQPFIVKKIAEAPVGEESEASLQVEEKEEVVSQEAGVASVLPVESAPIFLGESSVQAIAREPLEELLDPIIEPVTAESDPPVRALVNPDETHAATKVIPKQVIFSTATDLIAKFQQEEAKKPKSKKSFLNFLKSGK